MRLYNVTGLFGNVQNLFFVMANRVSFGNFKFYSTVINETNFPSINYRPDFKDLTNFNCLTGKINDTSKQLELLITDCLEQHLVFLSKTLFYETRLFRNVYFYQPIFYFDAAKQRLKTKVSTGNCL